MTRGDQEMGERTAHHGFRKGMKILYLNIYDSIKFSSHLIPTFAGKPFPHLGNYGGEMYNASDRVLGRRCPRDIGGFAVCSRV